MAQHRPRCAACGTDNEEDARFCEGCGGPLGRTCGTCGVEASATARFCRACGAALDSPDAGLQTASRKTVTVLFADLAGSTTFEEQVDVETAREVMGRYHDLLRSTAERHRVGITKYIGDGFMAVWGVPEIGADDAAHAVACAVELQQRFVEFSARTSAAHGSELALRVAVNTGEVVVGAGDADLVGDALNVAARLEAECPRGGVVVGEETWRSTRGRHRYEPLGEVRVKGRTAPVAVYRRLGRMSGSADAAPFVGRSEDLRRLAVVVDDAVAARKARLVTVLGDPGVGKSRLATEFIAARGGRAIWIRCAVEGTVALAAIVDVLRARDLDADVPVGVGDRDRMLRALKGLTAGDPGSVEETFWALRRFVEVLACDEPLILVVDDIQWADTLLLDFVEHLIEWLGEVPVLILALARPELRESRPDLATVSRWVTDAVHLDGLDPGATAALAAGVLGSARLPDELLTRLPASTGGNPLFVRELVGMLVHDGVLVADSSGWRLTIDVDAIAIPPTIQALLASRLERLNAADRRVLEVASVVGTDFPLGAVCALAGRGSAATKSSLDRLNRVELAQPSGTYLGDEPMWRFHHVLIRDVAYRRLLKSDRADLHQRLADLIHETDYAAVDSDEGMARHLEAAYGYRRELGTLDEQSGELALRSARCYLSAARRALDRDELVSAGTQAARGVALAEADTALQAELVLVGCEAFLSAGYVADAAPLVDDLDRLAGERLSPWAICYRCQFVVYTDPQRLLAVDARLQDAIDEFTRRRDPTGLAKAHRVRAGARARLGRIGDCEADLFEALIAARQADDHRQITAALGAAPSAALWGPSPVPKAGGRCLDVVRMQRMTTAAPSLEATSLRCLAVLELLRGRPDKARSMLADARQVVADLGLRHGLMETELFTGIIELMVGDAVAAEPHFRAALKGLDALGVGADAGQAAAMLARSLLAQGRVAEADRYATESERVAGHNLQTAIAWRAVRAEILAAQGEYDRSMDMAREAVAVAAGTDLVLDHAEACLALARVLAAAGDAGRAAAARRDAATLHAAKDVAFSLEANGIRVPATPHSPAGGSSTSRLTVANRASEVVEAGYRAMSAHDADAVIAVFSDEYVLDDRRSLSGDPIQGISELLTATQRHHGQYPHVEWQPLAIRGDVLELVRSHWRDDAGNETSSLELFELGRDGLISYHGRFDDDDFDTAYRELERRYYAGAGASFASNGHVAVVFLEAMDRLDVDSARRVCRPDLRWRAPPASLKATDRSIDGLFEGIRERARQVSSAKHINTVVRWLSPDCYVSRGGIHAAGAEGEVYEWVRLYVCDFRDGLLASVREFDVEDEDAAFAYAQTLIAPRTSRLAVENRASRMGHRVLASLQARNIDDVVAAYADNFGYEDRRRWSGDPIPDRAAIRCAVERIWENYNRFEAEPLAVRGERLYLARGRWSDDAGNVTTELGVIEIDDDERYVFDCRFDENDFWAAYQEMERRYYAGEGAAFTEHGLVAGEWVAGIARRDIDAVRRLTHPQYRWVAPPSALKPAERTIDELFGWLHERGRQVASQRYWVPVTRWLTPTCSIGLCDISAVGHDGEEFTWAYLLVGLYQDGKLFTTWEFDVDDEDAAFAFAESLASAQPSRLPLTNRASEVGSRLAAAAGAKHVDAAVATYAGGVVYDDRRRVSGDPIVGLTGVRSAFERLCDQYACFEVRTLAVRGERLHLAQHRWIDEAGNQSCGLIVAQVDDDGRIVYQGSFDEDAFEDAYRELEGRYYAGEGADYAEPGATSMELMAAANRGEFHRILTEMSIPGLRFENMSRSVFPDRSPDELRASLEELGTMVAATREWFAAVHWLSPNWFVGRHDREGLGKGGERYSWTRLYAGEIRGGLVTAICEFDVDDEDAAFTYAEERMRARGARLTVTNCARAAGENLIRAMRGHDVDGFLAHWSDEFVYEDRRRLSGDRIEDVTGLRAALERILGQYNHFDGHTLAVRGERLHLGWTRWYDDAGNESSYLGVFEVDDDGLIRYQGRFDDGDFEGAYRELERRYYAGEGAAYAETGSAITAFTIAINRRDLDTADRFFSPGLHVVNRPRSGFPDRSAGEMRASYEELFAMVPEVREWHSVMHWLSPTRVIIRHEREGVGRDAERYQWSHVLVCESSGGRLVSIANFDGDDEDGAFAYAEEASRP